MDTQTWKWLQAEEREHIKYIVEFLILKKKGHTKRSANNVANKLKNGERLSSEEFWEVYKLLHTDGPTMKYVNPDKWNIATNKTSD